MVTGAVCCLLAAWLVASSSSLDTLVATTAMTAIRAMTPRMIGTSGRPFDDSPSFFHAGPLEAGLADIYAVSSRSVDAGLATSRRVMIRANPDSAIVGMVR